MVKPWVMSALNGYNQAVAKDHNQHDKINWVKGSDDPTPYEKYKEEMNQALAKILHP